VSDISRRWIIACLIAAIASAAHGFIDFAVREWLEAGGAETPFAVTAIYAGISGVLYAGSLAVFAWFTGAVLRQIAPALPWRQWLALHLAIGIVLGFGLALTYTAPTGEPEEWSDTGFLDWMLLILFLDRMLLVFLFVAVCALVGAALGSLQALVLRGAAEGMRSWIVLSALATAVMGLAMIPTPLFSPSDGTFAREAAEQGVAFVGIMMAAFVMLPALQRLRPRIA
jgi:hypothetical protein